MIKFRFLTAMLPLIALAACADSKTAITEPEQVIPQKSRGELLADQLCAQCHGKDFFGKTVGTTVCPALDIVGTYSFEHFDAVLTAETEEEGSAMVAVENAFRTLSAADRKALHEYLASLLQLP